MRAGTLRQRVTLQRRVSVQSASGALSYAWEDDSVVWARVAADRGDKADAQGRLVPWQSTMVRIRYRKRLDTSYRVRFEGRTYEVLAVLDWEERGIYQDLTCREWGTGGQRGDKE